MSPDRAVPAEQDYVQVGIAYEEEREAMIRTCNRDVGQSGICNRPHGHGGDHWETPQSDFPTPPADKLAELDALLAEASELFSEIRGDWTEPKGMCMAGQRILSDARAIVKTMRGGTP